MGHDERLSLSSAANQLVKETTGSEGSPGCPNKRTTPNSHKKIPHHKKKLSFYCDGDFVRPLGPGSALCQQPEGHLSRGVQTGRYRMERCRP